MKYCRVLDSLKSVWVTNHRMQIFGSIPSPLYRSFSKLEYAEEFCAGRIRFQTLEYYKKIEDKSRIDLAEGVAELAVNGEALVFDPVNNSLVATKGIEKLVAPTFENSHFIYCLSLPQGGKPTQELQKFGKYIVKLNDPINFFRRIAVAIQKDSLLNINPPSFEASRVVYDKFTHRENAPCRSKLNRLRWMQKPQQYALECEYRLHFQACTVEPVTKDGTYYIDIPDGIGSYEIIEVSP